MAPNSMVIFFIIVITLASTPYAYASQQHHPVSYTQLVYWKSMVETPIPPTLAQQLSPIDSTVANKFHLSSSTVCMLPNITCFPENGRVVSPNGFGYSANIYLNPKNQSPHPLGLDRASFFRMAELYAGNWMNLTKNDEYPPTLFLPKPIAAQIQFTEERLKELFPHYFDNEVVKQNMDTSLIYCRAPAEEKFKCVSSLEQMIDFVQSILVTNPLAVLTSTLPREHHDILDISAVKTLEATESVTCHLLYFPFSAYYCHSHTSSKIFQVQSQKMGLTFYAVCHMDTSKWPSHHVAFQILKTSPGKGEACHWITKNDLIFISAATAKNETL